MTGNEYQKLAMRTAGDQSNQDGLLNAVLGLNGEAGEIADLLKKHFFQGHEFDETKLLYELGDVLWYVARACQSLNVGMDDVMQWNINKLKERYPDGFEVERSVNRNE